MSMPRLFLGSAGRLLVLTLGIFLPGPRPAPAAQPGTRPRAGRSRARADLGRRLVLLGFVPPFALLQLVHWVGFLLDELLFRGYRDVAIREPLFVLGVPRSGTTHLHRVLAQDERLVTFSTWECLLAPSVCERRVWLALGRLDRRVGRPLGRLLHWLERRVFGGLAGVHPMSLKDPEEDYFALLPVLATFILILPFPLDPLLWRMGTFDRDMPEPQRTRLLDFYRGCLQRHLYVHGPDKRLLSKNAAFAPLAGSLRERFPDARFLVCLREPAATLPSQLSSVESGVRLFGVLAALPDFRERLAAQLGFYYRNLERALGDLEGARCAWVTMDDLRTDLAGSVAAAYRQLGLPLDPPFRQRLDRAAEQARAYRSGHGYSLERYGLGPAPLGPDMDRLYDSLAARSVLTAGSSPPAPRGPTAPRAGVEGAPVTG